MLFQVGTIIIIMQHAVSGVSVEGTAVSMPYTCSMLFQVYQQ